MATSIKLTLNLNLRYRFLNETEFPLITSAVNRPLHARVVRSGVASCRRVNVKCIFSGFLLIVFFTVRVRAQNSFLPYSDAYRPDRLRTVLITETVSAAAISTGLYFLWYRKHPRSRFHFFNDNAEWLQVDKIGHATTA